MKQVAPIDDPRNINQQLHRYILFKVSPFFRALTKKKKHLSLSMHEKQGWISFISTIRKKIDRPNLH